MSNIIRHKRSTVAGLSPVAPDLVTGELAVNSADGRLYTLLTSNKVVDVTIPVEVDGGRIVIPSVPVAAGYNSANYGANANWNTSLDGNVLAVGTSGGPSAYGTFDQSGNVYEWLQSGYIRGGSYASAFGALSSISPALSPVGVSPSEISFRIASRSNPQALPNFVSVGDPRNEPAFNGVGSVGYYYYINKFAITNAEYADFLNAVAATDPHALYAEGNGDLTEAATRGIVRSGIPGSYVYSVRSNMADTPVNYVSLASAARYCNWLHNSGADTEAGAYTMANYTLGSALVRNPGAKYFIPTESEWYKAAYYKGDGAQSGYWRYATQADVQPEAVCATNIGVGTIMCSGDPLLTTAGDFILTQLNDNLITAQDF